MAAHSTHKRTTEGKRNALAFKAKRAAKCAIRPLDLDVLMSTLPRTLKMA